MAWVKPNPEEMERRRQAFQKISEQKSSALKNVPEQSVPEQKREANNEAETAQPVAQSTGKTERLSDGKFSVQLDPKDFTDKNNSPFANNPYNYKIAIGHPAIHPHYLAYKKFVEEGMILSDAQRHDFESYVLAELKRINVTPDQFVDSEKPKAQKKWGGYGR